MYYAAFTFYSPANDLVIVDISPKGGINSKHTKTMC